MFTRRQDSKPEANRGAAFVGSPPYAAARTGELPRTTPPPIGGQPEVQPFAAGAAADTGDGHGAEIAAEAPAESMIGQDLTIEGQSIVIRCRGALQINGSIEAELHSKEIVVGSSGTVQGSITADKIDVWGQVSGAIKGSRVLLHSSAQVEGDIHAASLSIEDGASFDGRSRKVTDIASVAPQLEAGSPQAATAASGGTAGEAPIPLPRTAAAMGSDHQ